MADSAVKKAIQRKLYASFSIALQGKYTPLPNNILEAMITDTGLTIEERFDALLDRKSFGNWSLYACERDWDTGAATILTQSDFATILNVDKQRINDVVVERRQQGYLQDKDTLPSPRMLARVLDPHGPRPAPAEEEPRIRWADFSDRWDTEHADLVTKRAELLAKAAPYLEKANQIHQQKLNAFKQAQKQEEGVRNSPDQESATPRTSVRNSPDNPSDTPRTSDARIHKGTRAKNNGKRLASGLVIPDEPSSSSSPQEQEHEPTTTTHPTAPRMMGKEFHRKLRTQFNGAGKPVPTRKQSDPIYERLAENCGLFLAWLTPRKLKPIKHPGALPELLDEFLDTLTVEPPPAPEPTTLKDQIEAWKWIAQNDEDLSIREHAKNELRKLGIEIGKGAS